VTQGNAWKTLLNSNIPQVTTKSALQTPRFNFALYPNYNLSFDLSIQSLFCNGPFAVQLQYSTDNGSTWTRLGGNSFYDAYPGAFCTITSQVFADGYGWSLNQNYSNKSIDVSFLSGQSSVIFRFVASIAGNLTGGYNIDGALIDNFQITASGAPLPLNAYSLRAKKENRKTLLNWSSEVTSSDIERFDIYRYSNVSNNFEVMGSVNVNDPDLLNYQFYDEIPWNGQNLYKIGALNWDGKTTFTNIAKVNHGQLGTMEVYPNPVSVGQYVHLEISDNQEIENICITDVTGKILQSHSSALDYKNSRLLFSKPGIYFAQIYLLNGDRYVTKIVVQL
jgi:hypothetical protein